MLYQQGDVLFYSVRRIPRGAVRKSIEDRTIILAQGEATGHAHTLVDEDVEVYTAASGNYIKSREGFTVRHEEHQALAVPAGRWRLGRVREYDHFEEESRPVRD